MPRKGKIVRGVYVLGSVVRAMSKDKRKRLLRRRGREAQPWVPYRVGAETKAEETE